MIYFDITDLMEHFRKNRQPGGVQRVSLATISHFKKINATHEIKLISYHSRLNRLASAEITEFPAEICDGGALCASLGITYSGPQPLDDYLHRRYGSQLKRALHKVRLSLSNSFTGGRTFRRKNIAAKLDTSSASRMSWNPVSLSTNDVVFVSGGPLAMGKLQKTIEQTKSDVGLKLVYFIHDILPISHPQFFLQGDPMIFAEWFLNAAKNADAFITSTKANEASISSELARRGFVPPTVSVVPLAHQFLGAETEGHKPVYEIVSAPILTGAARPFVLCVGTREVRKNNLLLAQVWQSLQDKWGHALPNLIFAGRRGWLNDEFERFLIRTDFLNGKIRLIDAPTEHELAYLYKSCLFSAYPSFAEGWGLPIGESLWFERPVVASNMTGMPEVAGSFVDYADPYDFASLKDAIEHMLDADYRQERENTIRALRARRWGDYANDLLSVLRAIATTKPQ